MCYVSSLVIDQLYTLERMVKGAKTRADLSYPMNEVGSLLTLYKESRLVHSFAHRIRNWAQTVLPGMQPQERRTPHA